MKPVSSPYIEVRNSRIHHKGVFAVRDIPKGTKIIEYVGRKLTKKESDKAFEENFEKHIENEDNGAVYIFELNKKYDIDGNVPWNTAKYINHSCNPNCETDIINDRIWIVSLRDIKKGEEITYNYGYDFDAALNHPCRCGSENCVGFILAEEDWPKLKKILAKRKNDLQKKSK